MNYGKGSTSGHQVPNVLTTSRSPTVGTYSPYPQMSRPRSQNAVSPKDEFRSPRLNQPKHSATPQSSKLPI